MGMSREEAKELFEDNFTVINTHGHYTEEEEGQAQELAISALSEELSKDGTLTVHVSDGSKVNRVLVMGENIFGGLYYPDSDFEGMTNGEVIKAMFPMCENFTPIVRIFLESGSYISLPVDWWNSLYQKGE